MAFKRNVVTSEQFKLFKNECYKYIDKLGLADWNICITCEGCVDECHALASVLFSPDGLNAKINLTKDWSDEPITKTQILRAALHEVCHILTARMENLAMDRFSSEKEIYEESERIARRVEHLVWGWKK